MSTTSTRPADPPRDRTMSATRVRLRMAASMMASQARSDALKDGLSVAMAERHAVSVSHAYLQGAADQARDTLKDAARRNAAAQDALEAGARPDRSAGAASEAEVLAAEEAFRSVIGADRPMKETPSEAALAAHRSDGPRDDLPQPGWFARLSRLFGGAA